MCIPLQGILSATEREVVQKNGVLASAFRDFAAESANTLDAHSLGAVGARNLMGMGFIAARVRMFGRPALSLGWTEKATNMCMVRFVWKACVARGVIGLSCCC